MDFHHLGMDIHPQNHVVVVLDTRSVMAFPSSDILVYACIKGYHAYKIKPDVHEELVIKLDHFNKFDKNAVGVYQQNKIVGHVPATPTPLHLCIKGLLDKYHVTW